MAVMIDTVANVKIKPDFSGFVGATEEEIVDLIVESGRFIRPTEAAIIARALLAGNWIIPR